jgi:hypothetical protein
MHRITLFTNAGGEGVIDILEIDQCCVELHEAVVPKKTFNLNAPNLCALATNAA